MIRVNQLSYHTGKRPLFDGLTFRQPPGTIAAILGPNGRGKTTLLRLLLSLQKGATGTVQLSAPAAYVPQLSGALFNYSVRTMVSLGRVRHLPWYASPSRRDHDITEQAMADLGLTPLRTPHLTCSAAVKNRW